MPGFLSFMDPLRHLTMENGVWVTLFRLTVAAICGGIIGLERGRKRRPAGFRTHMLVCMGATLAMLISQYLTMMAQTDWANVYAMLNMNPTDAARLGAQVINGIGLYGALHRRRLCGGCRGWMRVDQRDHHRADARGTHGNEPLSQP